MRTLRWLSLLLFFVGTIPSPRAETVATTPAPTGYINDYAGVISSPAQSEMESLCRELHDKTKAQIFVVTISTLQDTSIEQFANDLFHKWKIGEKKTDRGALLLFAVKDHRWRIEVGYGLEGILNDAKVGDIGRTMVPDLRTANYDNAIRLGLHSVAQAITTDSGVQLSALQASPAPQGIIDQQTSTSQPSASNSVGLWVPFVIVFWFAIVLWIIIRAIRKGTRSTSSSGWTSGDSSSFSSSNDSSSSSDSGFSGGDGGDSGGGGASGSW